MVIKLPDVQDRQPYDASCVYLKIVLHKTTESPVVKRLLKWGVLVMEEDVMAATKYLMDTQVRVIPRAPK